MSSRRQRSIPWGGRYRQVSLYDKPKYLSDERLRFECKTVGNDDVMTWEIFLLLLVLFEGHPPVTGGYLSTRASNMWIMPYFDISRSTWWWFNKRCRLADRSCDVTVMRFNYGWIGNVHMWKSIRNWHIIYRSLFLSFILISIHNIIGFIIYYARFC